MFDFLFRNDDTVTSDNTQITSTNKSFTHKITKQEALDRLNITEKDLLSFDKYNSSTPVQRAMMDLDFKEDLLSLLLMSNAYYKNSKDDLKFEFTDPKTFKEEAIDLVTKIDMIPNKILFMRLIYSIYGLYYVRLNGTKTEQLQKLASMKPVEDKEEILPALEPIVRKKPAPAATLNQERKRNKRNRQRSRKREQKEQAMLEQID